VEDLVIDGREPNFDRMDDLFSKQHMGFLDQMMLADMVMYLPDDILVKVDRASMAVGLETRVPFLDPRVVEFTWRIPASMKFAENKGKKILRKLLYRYVPKNLVERPKMGFAVPIGEWLRGPLKAWAEDLLAHSKLKGEGFFNPAIIQKQWEQHLFGHRNFQYQLWNVLMFESWLAANES
jgi:asparagine synthase (glutamine-hydrolysing)